VIDLINVIKLLEVTSTEQIENIFRGNFKWKHLVKYY
jgi:hypothetical protein